MIYFIEFSVGKNKPQNYICQINNIYILIDYVYNDKMQTTDYSSSFSQLDELTKSPNLRGEKYSRALCRYYSSRK